MTLVYGAVVTMSKSSSANRCDLCVRFRLLQGENRITANFEPFYRQMIERVQYPGIPVEAKLIAYCFDWNTHKHTRG